MMGNTEVASTEVPKADKYGIWHNAFDIILLNYRSD